MAEDEAVRDFKRALTQRAHSGAEADAGGSGGLPPPLRSSSSLPVLMSPLHPEIGRARDIAQPGGFRREHILRSNTADPPAAVHMPLLESSWSLLECMLDPRVRVSLAGSENAHTQALTSEPCASLPSGGRGSSNWATALLILKSTIGGTLILIPGGFKDAGLVSACMVLTVIGGVEIYCMSLLIRCSQAIGGGSYGDIVQASLGTAGAWAVDVSLVLSQLGFVCAEMAYVAKNGREALAKVESGFVPSETNLLQLQLLLSIPMSWIRRLRYFKASNVIANVTVFGALGCLCANSIGEVAEHGHGEGIKPFGGNWLLFAGTSVFSFECINFVIPMYDAHEKKETFVPILYSTLWFVVALFIGFGALNYVCYGEATMPVLTANLPDDSAVGKGIPFAFALASLLNIPLFLFPASITIEGRCFADAERSVGRTWRKNILRTSLVLGCTGIAIVGARSISAMVAIIGSVCCVPLAFIYPALSHLVLCKPQLVGAVADYVIILLGAFLFVMTTLDAIKELRHVSA